MTYRTVFRPPRWMLCVLVPCLVFVLSGVVFLYPREGASSLVIGLALLSVVLVAGIADGLVSRIVLGDVTLDVIEIHRRRSYPRAELVSAKVDGGHVCLERATGEWIVLPAAGDALSVCNSIRAWINDGYRE